MKTSERVSRAESAIKSAFAIADARAALHTIPAPPEGHTPAERIAAAVKTDAIQQDAPRQVERIREGLKQAVADATAEIDAIAHEAEQAHHLAGYLVGKASDLPAIPDHLAAAAMALKGQPGAGIVARQLVLAAENAEAEVARLKDRWLPRTKLAADIIHPRQAAAIFGAAGLDRRAQAASLMAERAEQQRRKHIENASRRRTA